MQNQLEMEPSRGNSPFAYVACAAGALFGALIWGGIAWATGLEIGLVAWLMGAGIGIACGYAGGRDHQAGILAATAFVVAIVGGKMLAIDWIIDRELKELPQMRMAYDARLQAARSYASLGSQPSDEDIQGYMAANGMGGAITVARFRADMAPELKDWFLRPPSYAGFVDGVKEGILAQPGTGKMDILWESIGFLDVIFLLFGITCAWGLTLKVGTHNAAEAEWEGRRRARQAGQPTGPGTGGRGSGPFVDEPAAPVGGSLSRAADGLPNLQEQER